MGLRHPVASWLLRNSQLWQNIPPSMGILKSEIFSHFISRQFHCALMSENCVCECIYVHITSVSGFWEFLSYENIFAPRNTKLKWYLLMEILKSPIFRYFISPIPSHADVWELCVCVCVYAYAYTCMYVCMYTYVCLCVYARWCLRIMCVYVCIYICLYVYVCLYVYICMFVCIRALMFENCVCVCVCIYICLYVYVCLYVYICMFVCIHMYVCMYTYVCLYTYICIPAKELNTHASSSIDGGRSCVRVYAD